MGWRRAVSARYRVRVCRCGNTWGLHYVVSLPGKPKYAARDMGEAFAAIARDEAHRLAGNDWALWQDGSRILAQRQGSAHVARFHSWGEVARFMAALADAGRAPLVVA